MARDVLEGAIALPAKERQGLWKQPGPAQDEEVQMAIVVVVGLNEV